MREANSKRQKSTRKKVSKDNGSKEGLSKRTLGSLFKLGYLKAAGKMGIIEKTSMDPNFERNMIMFDRYHNAIRQLHYGCERMIQPNTRLLQEMMIHDRSSFENPHMLLSTFYDYMKTVGTLDVRITVDRNRKTYFNNADLAMINSVIKLFKFLGRKEYENRELVTIYMRDTSEFLNKYEREYKDKRAVLKHLLLQMDDGGNQVKKSKTMLDLEKVGPTYEEVVNTYNKNAIDITDNYIYNYPKYNYIHQRDLIKFHMARAKYHRESARAIREWLKKDQYTEVRAQLGERKKEAVAKSDAGKSKMMSVMSRRIR